MINPVLVKVGIFQLRWYGMMTALGFLAGGWLLEHRRKRYGLSLDAVTDVAMIALIAGIIGARALYVIRFSEYFFQPGDFFSFIRIWEGGLVFQGGFVLALAAIVCYATWKRLPVFGIADLVAPALPLGHAFGRIGCLINKCCFGFQPYEGLFAIHYEPGAPGYFPVQLAESAGNLLICLAILVLERLGLAKRRLFLVYVMAYSALRFGVEFARGDYPLEQMTGNLTPAQVICLWLLPILAVSFGAMTWFQPKACSVEKEGTSCGKKKQQTAK